MTLEEQQFSSFNNANEHDLVQAETLDQQRPIRKSCFQESWTCAWAPDCSYIAWSQGGGIVYLLPWDRAHMRLLEKPGNSFSINQEPSNQLLIHNLPLLPSNHQHDNTDADEIISEQSLSSWDDEGKVERRAYHIDCCDYVWSMAFGSGISESNIKLWRRFIFNHDMILAVGLQSGKIKLFNVFSGQILMELLDHTKHVRGLNFSRDGSLKLISCSNDCTIKFWDLNHDGNMYKTLRLEKGAKVFNCKWSPNCKQVAAVGTSKSAYIWDSGDGEDFKTNRRFYGHHHNVNDCDYSPDGAIFLTASCDTSVILWDPYTGDMLLKLGHMFPLPRQIYAGGANDHYVRGISFSKDGQHIVSAADDGYVRFWNLKNAENPECIVQTEEPLCCQYSPNGHVVATGDREGNLCLYLPKQGVTSLQHMCRMVIRRDMPTQLVDNLQYPIRLKEYLKYKDLPFHSA